MSILIDKIHNNDILLCISYYLKMFDNLDLFYPQTMYNRLIILIISLYVIDSQNDEPEFLNPMSNVTVALGREAILVCSVKNIGEHKVSSNFCIKI